MIEKETQEKLVGDFAAARGQYEDLSKNIEDLARKLLIDSRYGIHNISSRCKTLESFKKKISLPNKEYASLHDITDISGLRITTYFASDVDVVANIIREEFAIDDENSVDKRQALDYDRFGYQSVHFVASLNSERCNLREYKRFETIKFEIQIRSILQHAWAEIEHDLGYKSVAGVPNQVRRRFARIAGLLEIADSEFLGIREELKSYKEEVSIKIDKSIDSVELDLISLAALYEINSQAKALDVIVKSLSKAQILDDNSKESFERLLPDLHWFNIYKVQELEDVIKENIDEFKRFAAYWIDGRVYNVLNRGVGVFYLIFLLLRLRKGDDKEAVFKFCKDRNFFDPESTVNRILEYKIS